MEVIHGCFVCKGDHSDNHLQSRKEVKIAINKLTTTQPTSFLSNEDMAYVGGLFTGIIRSNDADEPNETYAEAECVTEENSKGNDEQRISYSFKSMGDLK